MRNVSCILLCVCLLGGNLNGQSARASKAATTKPAITIGVDTTRITSPLKADGSVDYLAALNQKYSAGVTRENNAAVLLFEIFNPDDFLCDAMRQQVTTALGIVYQPDQKCFEKLPDSLEQAGEKALKGPWLPADNPELAAWLDRNGPALDKFIAASRRPRYYVPLVTQSPDDPLMNMLVPSLAQYRAVAKAMAMRANVAIAQGRSMDAWQDILAIQRVGILVGQDSMLIGRLVSIAMSATADGATSVLAEHGKLSAAQARQIIAQMQALGPTPEVRDVFTTAERYTVLDSIYQLARNPSLFSRYWEVCASVGNNQPTRQHMEFAGNMAQLFELYPPDYVVILRGVNEYFDSADKVLAGPFSSQKEEFEKLRTNAKLPSMPDSKEKMAEILQDEAGRTEFMGDMLRGIFLQLSVDRAQVMAMRAEAGRGLAVISVAMAGYKAQSGEYPDKLDPLVPGFLKSLPKDPFTGNAFVYRRTADGYIAYNVGDNMVDDGGKSVTATGKDKGDEIVVQAGSPTSAPAKKTLQKQK